MDALGFVSVPTLVLATGLVGLAVVAVLGLLAERHAGEPGFLAWTAGLALHTLGLVILGVEQAIPGDLDLTAGNVTATLSVLAYVRAAGRLSGRAPPWRLLIGATLAALVAIVTFTHVRYDLSVRVSAIALHFALGQTILIVLLARGWRTDRSRAFAGLLGLVVAATVTNVARAAYFALTGDADDAGGASSVVLFTANLVFFATSGLLYVAVLEDRARRALTHASAELARLARLDGLTGLANRRQFDHVLAEELERAQRYDRPLSLAMIDIDRFKRVNDVHGHLRGDDVLRAVASTVRAELRASDTAARFGGEELSVVLPETGPDAARDVAERIRQRIAGLELPADAGPIRMTVSIGVSTSRTGDDANGLTARADAALYAAKRAGRDRVQIGPVGPQDTGRAATATG